MKNKNIDISNINGAGFKTPKDYFEQFEINFQGKSIPVSNGFKTPDDYFENFEVAVQKENKLSAMNNPGFKTPDQYFEELEDNLILKTNQTKVISLKKRSFIKIALAVAASLLLFFSISKFNINDNSVDQVANTEIDDWLEEGIISFNTYEIEAIFSDEDLNLVADDTDEVSDYLKYTDIEILLLEN